MSIPCFIFLQTINATGLTHNKEKIVATMGYNGMSVRRVGVVVMTMNQDKI